MNLRSLNNLNSLSSRSNLIPLNALEIIISPKSIMIVGRIARRSIMEKNWKGKFNLLEDTYHLARYSIVKIVVKTSSNCQKISSYWGHMFSAGIITQERIIQDIIKISITMLALVESLSNWNGSMISLSAYFFVPMVLNFFFKISPNHWICDVYLEFNCADLKKQIEKNHYKLYWRSTQHTNKDKRTVSYLNIWLKW